MSQNLITDNNPNPQIGEGTLIFSGYFDGWEFSPNVTIPAGSYSVRTNLNPTFLVSPANYGKQFITLSGGGTITQSIVFQNAESNLKLISSYNVIPSSLVDQTGSSGSTVNMIHDGVNFYFIQNDGSAQATTLYYSTDAITWSTRALPATTQSGWSTSRLSFKYNANVTNKYIYTLNSSAGTNQIGYSTDAVTWAFASCASSSNGPANPLINNNLTDKYLVHLVQGSANATQISTSTNAVTWNTRTIPSTDLIRNIEGNGGSSGEVYVATRTNTTNNIITSTDGITWTSRTTGDAANAGTVNYIDGKWVVFYPSNPYTFATSTDAITWTARLLKSGVRGNTQTNYLSIVLDNKMFTQGASSGQCMVSTNGIDWDITNVGTTLFSIPQVYVNNKYYATTSTSIYISPGKTYIAFYKVDNQLKVV